MNFRSNKFTVRSYIRKTSLFSTEFVIEYSNSWSLKRKANGWKRTKEEVFFFDHDFVERASLIKEEKSGILHIKTDIRCDILLKFKKSSSNFPSDFFASVDDVVFKFELPSPWKCLFCFDVTGNIHALPGTGLPRNCKAVFWSSTSRIGVDPSGQFGLSSEILQEVLQVLCLYAGSRFFG